jgi:hypothetical protein
MRGKQISELIRLYPDLFPDYLNFVTDFNPDFTDIGKKYIKSKKKKSKKKKSK